MNRFDIHIIGWVMARDVCIESMRLALGGTPRIARTRLTRIAQGWLAARRSMLLDCRSTSWRDRKGPLEFSCTRSAEETLKAFLLFLGDALPNLYSQRALLERSALAVARTVVCLACSYGLELDAITSYPFGLAALALFFGLSSWCGIEALQFGRAYRLVHRFSA